MLCYVVLCYFTSIKRERDKRRKSESRRVRETDIQKKTDTQREMIDTLTERKEDSLRRARQADKLIKGKGNIQIHSQAGREKEIDRVR